MQTEPKGAFYFKSKHDADTFARKVEDQGFRVASRENTRPLRCVRVYFAHDDLSASDAAARLLQIHDAIRYR